MSQSGHQIEEHLSSGIVNLDDVAGDHTSLLIDEGPLGMICQVKNLYKEDTSRSSWWTDQLPARNDINTSQYALVVRNVSNDVDEPSDSRIQIHSVVIQSPLLRTLLQDLLEGYPGVALKSERLVFTVPFKPLVHLWSTVQSALQSESDDDNLSHLHLLVSTLEPAIGASLRSIEEFHEHHEITFQHLWTIFAPKDLVYTTVDKSDCAFRLKKTEYVSIQGRNFLLLDCVCIEWDGESFGTCSKTLFIPEYAGSSTMSELSAYPLRYHEDEDLQIRLRDRGRKFEEFKGYHYVAYDGIALDTLGETPLPYHVQGRIVIDAQTYFNFNPIDRIDTSPLSGVLVSEDSEQDQYDEAMNHPDRPRRWTSRRRYRLRSLSLDNPRPQMGASVVGDTPPLSLEQLTICSPKVRGFSFTMKQWLNFDVDNITAIKWNSRAFDNLVIPEDYKRLVLTFANSQRHGSQVFDDLISGKGKGIVMLLNGPPGVGKTLTAEAVAETMKVPLYSVSAGDLGIDPGRVERRLLEVFRVANAWKAVVLLDEADIFLEKRRMEDLQRNELVSIFLQNLEYFQGTLFLTTNRVEAFDPAFESRIHISLAFPDLNDESRRKIWHNFLNLLTVNQDEALEGSQASEESFKHEIKDEDLGMLSRESVNGRQIKNIIKAAELLSLEDKQPLRMEHLEIVMRITRLGRSIIS